MTGRANGKISAKVLLYLRVVTDHFINDEAQEFLREIRIKIGFHRERPQPSDLRVLSGWIGRGQGVFSLVLPDSLSHLEALGKQIHKGRIDIVDALAVLSQLVGSHHLNSLFANIASCKSELLLCTCVKACWSPEKWPS